MASPDLTLIADIDFRKGSQKLNRQLRNIEKRGINIDTRKSTAALGRITGAVGEFDKSLAASNARVIAFGASVAVIEGVRRSFVKLVDTIVQVEAQLTAINSILGRTSGNLQKFGNELFQIAKQTGQGFQQVAETAQEFARQGLSVEQTLARTKDALILQRLTTLKTEESVASLTAAINAFDKQALTSTQVINKLRAVETSFAVSSGDLADALARSASVAQDAGVSFDELLGVITAIKQRTGLGGATIGQGLKTVFTRLNLPTRIEQLRELGVVIDESAGGLEKLRQVSIAVGKAQEQGNTTLATQIGAIAAGQFQISKLSAAFSDLSSQYSVTDAAALKSAQATNEAIIANEEYNETIKSLANSVNQNIGQVLNKVGELGTLDVIKDFVKDVNSLLEAVQGNKAKAGTFLGEIVSTIALAAKEFGVLRAAAEGFANVLTGPGLVAAGSIIANLFKNTLLQGGQSLLSLTGINNKTKRRAELQAGVNKLLDQATAAEMRNFQAAKSVAAQQQIILGILQRQVALKNSIAASPLLSAIGPRSGVGRQIRAQAMAGGRLDPIAQEQSSIKRGVGGANPNAEVRVIKEFNYGNGKIGPAVVNTDEVVIPSKKGDIVLNRDMIRGAKNFARGLDSRDIERILSRDASGKPLTDTQLKKLEATLEKERGFGSKIDNNTRARLQTARQNEINRRTQKFQSRVLPTSSQGAFNPLVRREQEIARNRGFEVARNKKVREFMVPLRSNPQLALPGSRQLALPGTTLEDERKERGTLKFKSELSRKKAERAAKTQQKRLIADQEKRFRARDIVGALDVERQRQSFQSGDPIQIDRLVKKELFKEDVKSRLQAIREVNPEVDDDFLRNTSEGRELVRKTKLAAARDFRAQNEVINKQIREQKLTQARKVLDQESKGGFRKGKFGLRLPSLSRGENAALGIGGLDSAGKAQIRKEIQDRKFARGQRITQGAFIGSIAASFAAPGVGSLVERAGGSERAGRATTGLISGAASGAALGALAGPYGLAIGAVVGGIGGLVTSLQEVDTSSEDAAKKIAELRENLRDSKNNASKYVQQQSILNDLIEQGFGDSKKAELALFDLNKTFESLPLNFREAIVKANGDVEALTSSLTKLGQVEAESIDAQQEVQSIVELLKEIKPRSGSVSSLGLFSTGTGFDLSRAPVVDISAKTPGGFEFEDFEKSQKVIEGVIARRMPELVEKFGSTEEFFKFLKKEVQSGKTKQRAVADVLRIDLPVESFNKRGENDFLKIISRSIKTSDFERSFLSRSQLNEQLAVAKQAGTREGFVRNASDFFGLDFQEPTGGSPFEKSRRRLRNREGFLPFQSNIEEGEKAFAQDFNKTIQAAAESEGGVVGDSILKTLNDQINVTKDEKDIFKRMETILNAILQNEKISPETRTELTNLGKIISPDSPIAKNLRAAKEGVFKSRTTFDRDLGKFVPIGTSGFDRDFGATELTKKITPSLPAEIVLDSFQKKGFFGNLFGKELGPQNLSLDAQSSIEPRLQNDKFFFDTFLPSTKGPTIDPSVTAKGIERLGLTESVLGPSVGSDTKIKKRNGETEMVDTKTVEALEKLNTTLENFKQGDLGKIVQDLTATYKFVLDISSGGQITTDSPQKLEEEMIKLIRGELAKYDKRIKSELMGKPLPPEATA